MKKIAVILSGCGFKDGSEIHESVLTLLAIDKNNAQYQCFAPDINNIEVVNHITNQKTGEKRNVLIEAARIARGEIKPLNEFDAKKFDALILPGGFGAASNLSTFATQGADCTVNNQVSEAIEQTFKANKPIGALCIAPVILAKLIKNAELTIGDCVNTASLIGKMGAAHKKAGATDIITDKKNRLVTTPCYMLATKISEIAEGADNLVKEVLNLING
ncbi:MAG: isoprenoid biosynthesis glyoxalase ElbB [Deltaproteobacteria bacterium]|nr:isoprenoid biosynthesis glyoxalase ElbB [Deltaproteobacteria bacterium]